MKYIATFALALIGCAPKTEYKFYAPVYHNAALEAAAEWNQCGAVSITITDDPGDGIPVLKVTELDNAQPGEVGRSYYDPDMIMVVIPEIVRHEMGHMLGLHEHYGTGVMNAYPKLTAQVSDEDCARLRAIK